MSSVNVIWGKSGCFSEIRVKCIINTPVCGVCNLWKLYLMVHKVTTELRNVTRENNTLPMSVAVTTSCAAPASMALANVTFRLLVQIKDGKNSKQSRCLFSWKPELPFFNRRLWFGSDSNHVSCFASYFQFWTQFEFVRGFPLLTNGHMSIHVGTLGTLCTCRVPHTYFPLDCAEIQRKPSMSYANGSTPNK